jgi:hypothetical protein
MVRFRGYCLLLVILAVLCSGRLHAQTTDSMRVYVAYPSGDPVDYLYKGSANYLSIYIENLPASYHPYYEAVGGTVYNTQDSRHPVRLVPHQDKMTLKVGYWKRSKAHFVKTLTFNTLPTPLPEVVLKVDGRLWDGSFDLKRNSQLTLGLRPEQAHARRLRNGEQYALEDIVVTKVDRYNNPTILYNRVSSEPGIVTGIQLDLLGKWDINEDLDRVIVRIGRVVQIQRDGTRMVLPFSQNNLGFALPVERLSARHP